MRTEKAFGFCRGVALHRAAADFGRIRIRQLEPIGQPFTAVTRLVRGTLRKIKDAECVSIGMDRPLAARQGLNLASHGRERLLYRDLNAHPDHRMADG